jgi:hypothetical protein
MGFPQGRSGFYPAPEVLNFRPKILSRFPGAGREAEQFPPPDGKQGRYLAGQIVHNLLGPLEAGPIIGLVGQRGG